MARPPFGDDNLPNRRSVDSAGSEPTDKTSGTSSRSGRAGRGRLTRKRWLVLAVALVLAAGVVPIAARIGQESRARLALEAPTAPDAAAADLASTAPAAGTPTAARPVAGAADASSMPPTKRETAADFLALGDYQLDGGQTDQAIASYTRAIELKPDFAEAYNNRAYAYMKAERYALALPDLDQAIGLRPNYVNALMNRGDMYNYFYQIDYARALADYDRVLAIDAKTHNLCGHRLMALRGGWSPGVIFELNTRGAEYGCQASK